MKRIGVIVALWLMAASAHSSIPTDPEFSILWASFRCTAVVDSFLVASTDDGLMIARYDQGSGRYDEMTHVFLPSIPVKIKRYGDVLAVRTVSDIIYFVNVAHLPVASLLGQADPAHGYVDFAVDNQNLYLAMAFEGVWRYALLNYNQVQFVDSSLMPIHAVQVEIRNDTLYALDDYNGILKYDLTGPGFGAFTGITWIPLRASSFALADSSLVVALGGDKKILLLNGNQPADTVPVVVAPTAIAVIDTLVAVLDPSTHVIDIVNMRTRAVTHVQNDYSLTPGFQVAADFDSGHNALLFADYTGILRQLTFDDLFVDPTPKRAYNGPDLVTDFEFFDNRMYVSQLGQPVGIFEVEPSGQPLFDTLLFSPLKSATCLDQGMGRLLAYFPPIGAVFLTRYAFDSLFLDNYLDVDSSKVKGFASNQYPTNNRNTMLTWGGSRATVYILSDTLLISPLGSVLVQGTINTGLVARDWVAVASNKGQLYLYRLTTSDALEYKATFGVPRNVSNLVYDDSTKRLYALSGDRITTIELGISALPSRTEMAPIDIVDMSFGDNRLYTVGNEGLGVFARPSADETFFPALLDRGGRAGTMIKVLNDLVFTSNGLALNVYDLRIPTETDDIPIRPERLTLSPNYPNPFNPSTSIGYYLPSPGHVTVAVYNLLGQEVVRLVDEPQSDGYHEVVWDGTGRDRQEAATGVYFYRLLFDGKTETRKMMLLK